MQNENNQNHVVWLRSLRSGDKFVLRDGEWLRLAYLVMPFQGKDGALVEVVYLDGGHQQVLTDQVIQLIDCHRQHKVHAPDMRVGCEFAYGVQEGTVTSLNPSSRHAIVRIDVPDSPQVVTTFSLSQLSALT